MYLYEKLSERTGVKVYFVEDAPSPWQRGINENTNVILKQHLPKGIDLSEFSQVEPDAVAWELNTRSRKVSALNVLRNYFYLINLMPTNITVGLLY